MRVDAAPRTEVVLGCLGIEPVDGKELLALDNAQAFQVDGAHYRALSPTHRAGAAAGIDNTIWQIEFENDPATVTTSLVPRLNGGIADLMNWK